jgi:hypothetical protein
MTRLSSLHLPASIRTMAVNPNPGLGTPCKEQELIVSYTGAWCSQNVSISQSSNQCIVQTVLNLPLNANLRQILYKLCQMKRNNHRQYKPIRRLPLKLQNLKLLAIKMESLWNLLPYRGGFKNQLRTNPGLDIDMKRLPRLICLIIERCSFRESLLLLQQEANVRIRFRCFST